MASDYWDHVRSLAVLHDQIEEDQAGGEKGAVDKVVKDIETAARQIAEDAERVMHQLNAEADEAAANLKREAKAAVSGIRKGAAETAKKLMKEVQEGGDEKAAVAAAHQILKESELTTIELNRQAATSLKALHEQTEQATAQLDEAVEAAFGELAMVKEHAVKQVVGSAKKTAQQFPADAAPDDPETRAARQAAARVIKMLAQASESVSRSASEASARLQLAADEALGVVKSASDDASNTVHNAIDAANQKVLVVTQSAITASVGQEKAEFFDVESLRDKWNKRDF